MASALKEWRRRRHEAEYFRKAQQRSRSMLAGEVVQNVDLAIMAASQACTRYRQAIDVEQQELQLYEIRLQLECALGMLDNLLPGK